MAQEMSLLLSNAIEVFFNTLEDYLRFALAEFPNEPFDRIIIVFGIVATWFTALGCMTQRNHIRRDRSWIIGTWVMERNPMINRDSMPQTARASAYGAASMPIGEHTALLFARERIGQMPLSRSPAMGGNNNVYSPMFRLLTGLVAFLLQSPINRIGRTAFSFICINFMPMLGISFARTLFGFFSKRWITGIENAVTSFCIIDAIFSILLIVPIMLARSLSVTHATIGTEESTCVFLIYGEKYSSGEIFASAARTALERIRKIEHSVSLSLYHKMLATGGVIGRFSGATLDASHIIPRGAL